MLFILSPSTYQKSSFGWWLLFSMVCFKIDIKCFVIHPYDWCGQCNISSVIGITLMINHRLKYIIMFGVLGGICLNSSGNYRHSCQVLAVEQCWTFLDGGCMF